MCSVKNRKEKESFEIYNTYKPEIKIFELRINNEQTIKFREKRKYKNITCKYNPIKAIFLLDQAFIFTSFIIISNQYINSKNLFKPRVKKEKELLDVFLKTKVLLKKQQIMGLSQFHQAFCSLHLIIL